VNQFDYIPIGVFIGLMVRADNETVRFLRRVSLWTESEKMMPDDDLLPSILRSFRTFICGESTVVLALQPLTEWNGAPATNEVMSALWLLGTQVSYYYIFCETLHSHYLVFSRFFSNLYYVPSFALLTQSKTLPNFNLSKFSALVKELVVKGVVDYALLKGTLELSSLVDLSVIRDEESHLKRVVKINTGLVYRQQKYNLLREETEGYAKLLVTLKQGVHDAQACADTVRSLIGQFDLDPNRVFDVLLDCAEQSATSTSSFASSSSLCQFLDMLRALCPTHLAHTLGFKFVQFHRPTAESATGTTMVTPQSLLRVAASLIVGRLVSLIELLPYLLPNIEDVARAVQERAVQVQKQCMDPKYTGVGGWSCFPKLWQLKQGSHWQTTPLDSAIAKTAAAAAPATTSATTNSKTAAVVEVRYGHALTHSH
jgi:hypothetical protein